MISNFSKSAGSRCYRQLIGPYWRQLADYRSGLMEIDKASAAKFGKGFAGLDEQQQTR